MLILEKKSSRRLCYDGLCLFPLSQSSIMVVEGANKGCRHCWRPFSQYQSCKNVEIPILWDKMRIDEPLLGRKLFPPVSTSDLVLKMLLSGRMDFFFFKKRKIGIWLQIEDKVQRCVLGRGGVNGQLFLVTMALSSIPESFSWSWPKFSISGVLFLHLQSYLQPL